MMSDVEHIEKLRNAILQDAQNDADAILAQASAEAQEIKRRTESRTTAEVRRLLRETHEQAEAASEQLLARARLEAQMLKLQRREALLERIFDRARNTLTTLPDQDRWPDTACAMIREAIERLGGASFTILADADTRDRLEGTRLSILAAELNVNLTLGAPLEKGTGVVVLTSDGHRRFDNTLEARLERIQDELRAPVYRILTGDRP